MLHSRYFVVDLFSLPSDLLSKAMLALRSLISPVQSYRWRRFMDDCRILSGVVHTSPHLRSRIYRPYLSSSLGISRRVELLIEHYRLAFDAGCGNLIRKTSVQPMTVADLTGRSGSRYQLTLASADASRPEGEWVLRLKSAGTCIYTAAFSLVEDKGAPSLKLGTLFGLLATDDQLCIKSVTRDLCGCKPRELMIAAVCEIARLLRCRRLILSGNRNKLPPTARYVCRKSSDYDRLWKEVGAHTRDDGDYELGINAFDQAVAQHAGPLPPKRTLLLRSMLLQIEHFLKSEAGAEKPQ